jgi:hypothetical protein
MASADFLKNLMGLYTKEHGKKGRKVEREPLLTRVNVAVF